MAVALAEGGVGLQTGGGELQAHGERCVAAGCRRATASCGGRRVATGYRRAVPGSRRATTGSRHAKTGSRRGAPASHDVMGPTWWDQHRGLLLLAARPIALGKKPYTDRSYVEGSLPSAALGKTSAECFRGFSE